MSLATHDKASLLRTKLNRPRLGPDMVVRRRLLDRLEQAARRPVILVSAPAGYGKTTVVDSWLETTARPYAWLSLDEHDATLVDVATYLVAALRTAYPEAGRNLSAALDSPVAAQPDTLAPLFLRDLETLPEPLVLVLDDYHFIRNVDVHTFMARVVQRVPAGIHLVLTSRNDPPIGLARLQGRGQLAELRGSDLRFTRDEAAELVQNVLGESVAGEIVDLLHERTEGWPLALQLTGLALREAGNRLDFARRFAQSSHRPVMDYLLNEVLAEVSEEQYGLILRTSLLDRFCAPLWEVLAEGTEAQGQSQALIDRAWQSNLFLVALDAEGVWYRYHHLFRDLLRQQLKQTLAPDILTDLHRRVSGWFERNGLLEEAIAHAASAGDVVRTGQLIEANLDNALNREDWHLIERWLALLPETALQRPGILLAQAYLQHFRFNLGSIDGLLDRCAAALAAGTFDYSEDQITQLSGHIHMLRANFLLSRSPEQRLHHASLALQNLAPEARFAHSQAELYYGVALDQAGQSGEALAFLSDRLRQQLAQPDTRATRLVIGIMAIHYNNADLASMRTTAQTLLSIAQTQERLLSSGWAHFSLGWTSYQRNELDLAVQHFSQGIAVRYAINARASIDCYLGLALAQQAQGHSEAALQTAIDLRQFLMGLGLFNLAPVADALDLRLAWDGETQAGPNQSRQASAGLTMQPETQLAADMMVLPVLAAAQASIANGAPDSLTAAWSLLQRCRGYAEGTNSRRRLIEIGALEAKVHAARGEDEAALSTLRTSVLLAAPGGALRLIADAGPGLRPYLQQLRDRGVATAYVNRVLELYRRDDAAAPAPAPGAMIPQPPLLPPPSASPDMVEDLTKREIEVLILLAQGLSNKEIAAELTVSPNTVKKHTVNLYQKLQVRNRQRAIRAARALGYLPQDR